MGISGLRHSRRSILCLVAGCQIMIFLTTCGCAPSPERTRALEAIARWEDRRLADTDSLITMMSDPDAHIRRAAMRGAGLIGRNDMLPEMIAGLADHSEAVAVEAATALGFLADTEAYPHLRKRLASAGPNLRRSILFALGHISNDGEILIQYALGENRTESGLAWDALLNQVAEMDSNLLHISLVEGLDIQQADPLWRVLRCAERSGDQALVNDIIPFTTAPDIQTAVQACRALGKLAAGDPRLRTNSIAALQGAWHRADRKFPSTRDRMRLRVAVLRALGQLAAPILSKENPPAGEKNLSPTGITAILLAGIRDPDTHIRRTALETTADLFGPLRLPPEASRRESLLPVWRIQLLQAATANLLPLLDGQPQMQSAPEPILRAAAALAACALRGPGIENDSRWPALIGDQHLLVQAAFMRGMAAYCFSPDRLLQWSAGLNREMPTRLKLAATEALLSAWDRFASENLHSDILDSLRKETERVLGLMATGEDAAAANAATALGEFPAQKNLDLLCRIYKRTSDSLAGVDIRLGVLAAMERYFDDDQFTVPDTLRRRSRRVLEKGFDAPTLNLRLAARRAATAGDLFRPEAIPTAASLRATLPPTRRHPEQAPLTLPFDAPRIRCTTARGDFVIQLDGRRAPNTTATFLGLIKKGFYDDLSFHRVVPDFVIQGGCPNGNGWGAPGFTIRSEWSRLPFVRGTVGIAHSGKDTGGSQFFVALSPQPHLNGRYTIFGRVVSGMDVAENIQPDDTFRLTLE